MYAIYSRDVPYEVPAKYHFVEITFIMSTAHRLHVFAEAPVEPLRNSFTIQLLTSVSSTTPPSPSNYWHLYLPQHHLHHPITGICIFHSTTFTIQLLTSVSSTAPPSPSNYWHLYLPQHHRTVLNWFIVPWTWRTLQVQYNSTCPA